MSFVWISIFIIAIIVEAITPSVLISIWVAFAALVCAIFAYVQTPLWLQIVLFIVTTILFMMIIRPIVKKYLCGKSVATNADRVIGCIGIVCEDITDLAWGIVKINGNDWHAISSDGLPIEKGTQVKVCSIDGVKLVVNKI